MPHESGEEIRYATNSLTPAQLESAAGKHARPEALTWVMVGGLARIEAAVRASGIGEVMVLDADGNTS